MRKMLLTLALIAAPAIAVAQQPAQASQTPAAARDTTKAKPKTATHRRKRQSSMAHATTKAKPATPATQDTTKKP
jgi:hypothetical protein